MGLEAITPFDAAFFVVVLLSGIIAFARGFIREVATITAFILAIAGAYFACLHLQDPVASAFPASAPFWLPTVLIAVIVFIAIYVIVAILGRRVSKGIHGFDGLGPIDRILGFLFGAARGALAGFVAVFLLSASPIEEDRLPEFITGSVSYPYLKRAVTDLQEYAAELRENDDAPLPTNIE